MDILTDEIIENLINEEKILNLKLNDILNLDKEKKGHKEKEITVPRPDGSSFKIIIRQNKITPLDFSVILGYESEKTNKRYLLRRYNGKSHRHKNHIEQDMFFGFHIHYATERYQKEKLAIEGYAEVSSDYSDIRSALKCLVEDCNIKLKKDPQLELFEQ